jgi:hypothetical protein
LTQSRQLLGSFSRSFSRGVNRGLRRSASFVQLVWSYPTGWQPQRGWQQRGQGGRQENAAGGGCKDWVLMIQLMLFLCDRCQGFGACLLTGSGGSNICNLLCYMLNGTLLASQVHCSPLSRIYSIQPLSRWSVLMAQH